MMFSLRFFLNSKFEMSLIFNFGFNSTDLIFGLNFEFFQCLLEFETLMHVWKIKDATIQKNEFFSAT